MYLIKNNTDQSTSTFQQILPLIHLNLRGRSGDLKVLTTAWHYTLGAVGNTLGTGLRLALKSITEMTNFIFLNYSNIE